MPKKNPYDINVIFEEMTLELIASLKRNSLRHKVEETKEGFKWEQWQSAKLRALTEYRKQNRVILRNSMKEAEIVVDDVLSQSFKEGESRVDNLWKRFIRFILKPYRMYEHLKVVRSRVKGTIEFPKDFTPRKFKVPYKKLPQAPLEKDFFGMNEKKLEALKETVKNDLKKAQHGVLRKMDDVYRQVIYKTEVNMAAGAKTLNQAIDMATKEFLEKGINIIEYSDGRRVTISAYAEMALRTASQRATFLGEGKKRDELGVYTVIMSTHVNCSPMCLPYQGTVMIDDVFANGTQDMDPKLKLLSEAMKNYAFHPNCRHTLATYFPGISSIPEPVDDEKVVTNYEAEQQQRYIERQIRKYKRLHSGSVDEVNQLRYKKKVEEWQGRLEEHLKQNDFLRRDRSREKVG